MIKLKNILFQRLFERSIPEIQNFPIDEIDNENALETFYLWYELEYKYNQIKNNLFKGVPQRKENLLKTITNIAVEINGVLADSFIMVFEKWLRKHAILNPTKWAEAKYVDIEDENFEFQMNDLFFEYNRYSGPDYFDTTIENIIEDIGNYPNLQKLLNFGVIDFFQVELDNVDWGDFFEMYEGILGMNGFKIFNKDDFQDLLDSGELPTEFLLDYTRLIGSNLKEFSVQLENLFNFVNVDEYDIIVELYVNLVFPVWYSKWKAEGIDETRANVEDVYENLKKINSFSIEKQFIQINIAINTAHQTGSMMDYYEEHYGVNKFDLTVLSNKDTTEWDEELEKIGVII